MLKLSVVIPAHNEADCITQTVECLIDKLNDKKINHEILVINDNSSDSTENILIALQDKHATFRYINNIPPHGFGFAVRCGLENFTGDAVAVYMADASDTPEDLILFYQKMLEGFDCVFGTRWSRRSNVYDYPIFKRFCNRLGNTLVQLLLQISYNDTSNAFKLYRRHVIDGLQPILSHHFNLTIELPLKAIVRGYSYAVLPNTWINRKTGVAKFKIKEMGSRYFFILFYVCIEKWLSTGDYHRTRFEKHKEIKMFHDKKSA